jgi:hypothetical protein
MFRVTILLLLDPAPRRQQQEHRSAAKIIITEGIILEHLVSRARSTFQPEFLRMPVMFESTSSNPRLL